MTLDEARAHIGAKVIYRAAHSPAGDGRPRLLADEPQPGPVAEEGVITSVGQRYVSVRYNSDVGAKATAPEMLTLLWAETARAQVDRTMPR